MRSLENYEIISEGMDKEGKKEVRRKVKRHL